MNKESAKDFLPLVQALAEGKVIQHRGPHGWYSVAAPSFDSPASDYRIKPEPVGPEEVWILQRHGDPICVYPEEKDGTIRYIRADLAGEGKP